MDGDRFDRMAKLLADGVSRRTVLRGVAAGLAGAVGLRGTVAAVCRMPGDLCREGANCCSGLCGDKDATGRRRCRCRADGACPPPAVCCAVACQDGACVVSVLAGGTPCTALGGAAGTCRGGACVVPTTTTTTSPTTSTTTSTTSTTTPVPLAPFGAACAASSECASNICACRRFDCAGGGQCANGWVFGCVEVAGVALPGGEGAKPVCTTADSIPLDCKATACPAGYGCEKHNNISRPVATRCIFLAQSS